jgi:nucleoside-diphosphate kinase
MQVSDIIGRFERKGYKLVAIKIIVPSKEFAGKHYAEHEGRPFFEGLTDFLSSGPVLAMVSRTNLQSVALWKRWFSLR